MYTAEIVSKEISKGVLKVNVKYTNGIDTFFDYIETTQNQDDTWPYSIIERKLSNLNNLPILKESIELAQIEINGDKSTSVPVTVLDQKEEYKKDLQMFDKYVSVLAKGFTTEENAAFIALKKKLTDNFKDEYIDLF